MKKIIIVVVIVSIAGILITGCTKPSPSESSESIVSSSSSFPETNSDYATSDPVQDNTSGATPPPSRSISQSTVSVTLPKTGYYVKNLGSASAIYLQLIAADAEKLEFSIDAKGVAFSGIALLDPNGNATYKNADCTLVFHFDETRIFIEEPKKYNGNVDLGGNYEKGQKN
ncbi:hypothetical protein [Pygmaiobacter massiliensis]|uniref:hypothetical protein n=1 Tax=Pygmaiobacter massiliensis TaxID=1917873 RepID=UPI00289CCF77|nr:hypothetical protein [Pygmaiobacter massiliensis]